MNFHIPSNNARNFEAELVHCQRWRTNIPYPKFLQNNFLLFNSILLWIRFFLTQLFTSLFFFFSFTQYCQHIYAHTQTHTRFHRWCVLDCNARAQYWHCTLYWLCWGEQERQREAKHRDNEMSKQTNGYVQWGSWWVSDRVRPMYESFLFSFRIQNILKVLSFSCVESLILTLFYFTLFSCTKRMMYKWNGLI